MSDFITILRSVSGARMTKLWRADGSIEGYEDAKTFIAQERQVTGIASLAEALGSLSGLPDTCAIRGGYPVDKIGQRVLRQVAECRDTPHHWMMVDVDDYEPIHDPTTDTQEACLDFILDCLPAEFQEASFYWQLSSSAGAPGNAHKLKCHIWFWLASPCDSPTLREWAKRQRSVDPAVFRQVQPHYTADPVLEPSPTNAVLKHAIVRSGLYRGVLGDDVALDLGYRAPADAFDRTEIEVDLDKLRAKVPDYDLDRVESEILLHLDPNMGHDDWVMVGMALHHQFDGSDEALALWDEWSSNGSTWAEGVCAERWPSFNDDRMSGDGAVTLRYLLKETKEERKTESVKQEAAGEKERGTGNGDRLATSLALTLQVTDTVDFLEQIKWSSKEFDRQMSRVAFHPGSGQFTIMTDAGLDLQALQTDLPGILREHFPPLVDTDELERLAAVSVPGQALAPTPREKWIKEIVARPYLKLAAWVKAHRQFETTRISVNIFSEKGRMKLRDKELSLIYPHVPFREGPVDEAVAADYRAHWPGFDDYLDLLAAARFAHDRKKAHVWLHACSDWGKGLLADVLTEHGLVYKTTSEALEKIMAGGPVGTTAENMRRVWVLLVNEFRGVTREIKELESSMSFSPKNKPQVTMPLYLKHFSSAEDAPSLASAEAGIESQFLNRFMYMSPDGGPISTRPVHKAGKAAYYVSVRNLVGRELNQRVAAYKGMGADTAVPLADATLDRLHAKYDIRKAVAGGAKTLSEKVEEIAATFAADAIEAYRSTDLAITGGRRKQLSKSDQLFLQNVFVQDGSYWLKRATATLGCWIDDAFDKSAAGAVRYKKKQILSRFGDVRNMKRKDTRQAVEAVRLCDVEADAPEVDDFMA